MNNMTHVLVLNNQSDFSGPFLLFLCGLFLLVFLFCMLRKKDGGKANSKSGPFIFFNLFSLLFLEEEGWRYSTNCTSELYHILYLTFDPKQSAKATCGLTKVTGQVTSVEKRNLWTNKTLQ
jgi:hypothetical protein